MEGQALILGFKVLYRYLCKKNKFSHKSQVQPSQSETISESQQETKHKIDSKIRSTKTKGIRIINTEYKASRFIHTGQNG